MSISAADMKSDEAGPDIAPTNLSRGSEAAFADALKLAVVTEAGLEILQHSGRISPFELDKILIPHPNPAIDAAETLVRRAQTAALACELLHAGMDGTLSPRVGCLSIRSVPREGGI